MRPMLAATLENWADVTKWPVLASPKVDGFRVLIGPSGPVTRYLKPFPNYSIRQKLSSLPVGLDGEIASSLSFHETSSLFRRAEGEPDFTFYLFDYVKDWKDPLQPYIERYSGLRRLSLPSFCQILPQIECHGVGDLKAVTEKFISDGFEGVCFRTPCSPYKFGRSTLKEAYLVKYKPFVEALAEVIGVEPLMHNENPKFVNALGLAERSSCTRNLTADETLLGTLLVRTAGFSQPFYIGSGFSMAMRARLMEEHKKGALVGTLVPFKYMDYGCKDAPRHPVFLEQEYERRKGECIL